MFENNLKKIKDKVLFREEKKAEIRKNLLSFIASHEVLRAGEPGRHIWQRSVHWLANYQLNINFMPIFAVLLAAVLLGGGTSLAAQNSLPGDVLYPVKINVNEKVESALALNANDKADLQAKLAEMRLVEAEKLSEQGRLNAKAEGEVNAHFKANADAAQNLIADLKEKGDLEDAAAAATELETGIRAHGHILSILGATSTVNISGELKDAESERGELESEIAAGAHVKNPDAAEARINAATKAIADVQAKFNSDKASLNASTTASIQANLDSSNKDEADARAQFAAKNYAQAFVLANQAFRIAEETRVFFSDESELNIGDEHENETPEASESPEPSGNHSDESGTNVSGSSSVGVHGDNGEVNVNGSLNLRGE